MSTQNICFHGELRKISLLFVDKSALASLGSSVGAVRHHSFVEIDNDIFFTVILSLPLIQEGSCQFLAKECA